MIGGFPGSFPSRAEGDESDCETGLSSIFGSCRSRLAIGPGEWMDWMAGTAVPRARSRNHHPEIKRASSIQQRME